MNQDILVEKNVKQEDQKDIRIIRRIVFFGGADVKEDSPEYKVAYETAALLAEKDYVVVDGGGTGIMYAASAGAKSKNGKTIGVTLKAEGATHFEGRVQTKLLDQEIKTVNYLYRTMRLLENGDAYLVFKGGTGTISELGMAWALARIYYDCHKSLILVGDFWHNVMKILEENILIRPEEKLVYEIVNTAEEVLKTLEKFEENAIKNGCHTKVHYKDAMGFVL